MKYNRNNNTWGKNPNELLQRICDLLDNGANFLDLGCGQGRDSLFMLQKGFKVDAVDNSQKAIEQIKKSIQTSSLPVDSINLFYSDIISFDIIKNKYDIINAYNSLQFLPKKEALRIIESIKSNIKENGYVIISGFTTSDPLYKKIDNSKRCFFDSQELRKMFSDFNIVEYKEEIIEDKGHQGSPKHHIHGIVQMIAQKIKNSKGLRDLIA